MGLRDRVQAEVEQSAQEADDKATIRRLNRRIDKLQRNRDELVEAVYNATMDAARGLEIKPVKAPTYRRLGKGSPEAAIACIGDWQLGKLTPDYNSDVCEERVERFGDKVINLTSIQRKDHPVDDLHIFALGDLIEGELIFPGQEHRIDSSLYRQVSDDGTRILLNFTRRMLSAFKSVTLHEIDGNHGAIGGPFRRSMHPESNGDRMLYRIVNTVLTETGQQRVHYNFPDPDGERNWYAVAKVGNYTSLLMHGDQFRGTAGMPWYSIQKKAGGWALGAIEEFALAFGQGFKVDIDFGHWHQPTRLTLNKVTARCNGSTESYNTYAIEQLAAVGEPSQSLRFVHPEKGRVTAEYTVYLP